MNASFLPSHVLKAGLSAALLCSVLTAAQARDGMNAAIIGGAAAGVVGGLAAGAIMNQAHPGPVYVAAPPPPPPVIVERPMARPVAYGEVPDAAFGLNEACQAGDRRACIRFGILIGRNQEKRAEWARVHPEMYWWDR